MANKLINFNLQLKLKLNKKVVEQAKEEAPNVALYANVAGCK